MANLVKPGIVWESITQMIAVALIKSGPNRRWSLGDEGGMIRDFPTHSIFTWPPLYKYCRQSHRTLHERSWLKVDG